MLPRRLENMDVVGVQQAADSFILQLTSSDGGRAMSILRYSAFFLCLAVWAALGRPAAAQELEKIPAAMQRFVDDGEAAGIVCLVSDGEKTLHLSAVGYADLERKTEMKPDAIFRVASMTKPVTSVALMQLVAAGKLQLDDPVSKYIPSFSDLRLPSGDAPARPITVRDVMTHTAGIAGSAGFVHQESIAQFCDDVAKQPLAFAPGEKWAYSSGITIGGRLIEVVSGEDYASYLKRHIFEPLEMRDSGFTLPVEQARRVASMYKKGEKPGELVSVENPNPTLVKVPSPSAGLYSTAEDMARFYRAVLSSYRGKSEDLLAMKAAKEMLTPQTGSLETGFTPGNAWGIGWCLVQKPQGVTRKLSPGSFGHGGVWGTQGWVDPTKDRIVILMLQRVGLPNSDASEMREALNELALP